MKTYLFTNERKETSTMSDKLKKYFEEQRAQFDVETPPDLWQAIEKELPPEGKKNKIIQGNFGERRSVSYLWKVAAILLMVFGLGFWAAKMTTPSNTEIAQQTTLEQIEFDLAKIAPEMAETESFYFANIASFKKDIEQFKQSNPEIVKEFLAEHKSLDKLYNDLKLMLLKDVDNEKILDLMVQNLQLRMTVLQKQKSILQNILKQKSGNHEGATIL